MNCALTVPRCAGHQPPMLFLYIYHIRRRRTWTEDQRGRRTWTWRLCCCCVVPWRRGATAWAHGARDCTARASTSKIVMVRAQYTFRGSCLRTFCFFFFCQFLLLCVAMSRGFCVAMLGAKCGPCNQRARKPPAAPQSRSPRRAELSWRVRNVSVRVQARVRVVCLHGGWQPQKERRGVFFGD